MGRPRLHRGAHGRRAHPPSARSRSSRSAADGLIETVRGSGYRLAVPRQPDPRRSATRRSAMLAVAGRVDRAGLRRRRWRRWSLLRRRRRGRCVVLAHRLRAAIIGFHLLPPRSGWRDWAAGPLDATVPEGRGVWAHAVRRDLSARAHARTRTSATSRTTIERFRRRRRGDARRHGRARRAATASTGPTRARWRSSASTSTHDIGPADRQSRAPAGVPPLPRGRRLRRRRSSSRRGATRGTTLAMQLVPFGVDEKLLMSPRHHAARGRRADAPRLHRQRVARAQDAAHRDQRLRRDDAGPGPRRPPAQALPAADARAGAATCSGWSPTCSRCRRSKASRTRSPTSAFAIVPLLLALSADAKALSKGAARDRARHRRAGDDSRQPRRARERVRQSRQQRDPLHAATAARSRSRGASMPTARGVFAVADTRHRHRAEHMPRLTERFYRVDRSRSRATGGTGPRPRDRQARAAAPPGGARDRQRAGQGQHVRRAAAGARASSVRRPPAMPQRRATRTAAAPAVRADALTSSCSAAR